MSKFFIAILFAIVALSSAEIIDSYDDPKYQQPSEPVFVPADTDHKDYNGGIPEPPIAPGMPGQTTGNTNIQVCLGSVQNLQPAFTKLLADSQFMPTHQKSVRNFKVLAAQLQEVANTCGVNFGNMQGAGVAANCDNDVKQVNQLVQSLVGADDNYFFTMGKLMSLGQILPQAIRDCSEE